MKSTFAALTLALAAAPVFAEPIAGEEVIEPTDKQLRQLGALTPESVERKVTVDDDSLEPFMTLSTERVWKSNGRFTDRVRADNFLRAFIGKRTGETRFQLYQVVTYSGDWRRFISVNYATADGAVGVEVTPISQEVVTCSYGLCVYREVVGFDMSRVLLERVASEYSPDRIDFWRFRFKGRGGLDWEDRIAPAEVAGLLRAVDSRLAKLKRSD